jgi:hypothetical protein
MKSKCDSLLIHFISFGHRRGSPSSALALSFAMKFHECVTPRSDISQGVPLIASLPLTKLRRYYIQVSICFPVFSHSFKQHLISCVQCQQKLLTSPKASHQSLLGHIHALKNQIDIMDSIPGQLKASINPSLTDDEEHFYQTNCVPEFFRQRIPLVTEHKDVLQALFQCCAHMEEDLRCHALLRLQPARSVLASSVTRLHYITCLQRAPQSTWTTPSQIDSWIGSDVSRILTFRTNPEYLILTACDLTDFVIVMEKAQGNDSHLYYLTLLDGLYFFSASCVNENEQPRFETHSQDDIGLEEESFSKNEGQIK